MLEDRAIRNRLRHTVIKAEKDEIITQEEVVFIVSLIEKGRKEIERKIFNLNSLKGQIVQLKENDTLIADSRDGDTKLRIEQVLREKFTLELESKETKLTMLKGEIAQLRANEQAIMGLIENLVKSKERDIARQETAAKLRAAKEIEAERHRKRKEVLLKKQGNTVKETRKNVEKK